MDIVQLSENDVYSQEGKLRHTEFCGKKWQNRKLLGEYGNHLEAMFGHDIMPTLAIRKAYKDYQSQISDFDASTSCAHSLVGYTFGSVRRQQGKTYHAAGGVVVEITRPNNEKSGNEFDLYDERLVDYRIRNQGVSLEELEDEVRKSDLARWISWKSNAQFCQLTKVNEQCITTQR